MFGGHECEHPTEMLIVGQNKWSVLESLPPTKQGFGVTISNEIFMAGLSIYVCGFKDSDQW